MGERRGSTLYVALSRFHNCTIYARIQFLFKHTLVKLIGALARRIRLLMPLKNLRETVQGFIHVRARFTAFYFQMFILLRCPAFSLLCEQHSKRYRRREVVSAKCKGLSASINLAMSNKTGCVFGVVVSGPVC